MHDTKSLLDVLKAIVRELDQIEDSELINDVYGTITDIEVNGFEFSRDLTENDLK